jgi:hypothetical protein
LPQYPAALPEKSLIKHKHDPCQRQKPASAQREFRFPLKKQPEKGERKNSVR